LAVMSFALWGAAAEPVYRQDFEAGAAGFPAVFCGVDNGSYLVEIQSGSYSLDFPIPGMALADFRLEVTVTLECSQGEVGFGLYFRDSAEGGYEVELSEEGDVYLWRYGEDGYELLLDYPSLLWVRVPGENRLVLVCQGSSLSLSVNGHKVLGYAGLGLGEGGLGLWATNYNDGGALRLRFDDLEIWSLGPA